MTHHEKVGVLLDGKYRLDTQLAEGGMGVLYRATEVVTGRQVAVKLLRAEQAQRDDARARFALEARAVRALRHPNIVQVLSAGEDAHGTQYLVMELLEGVGLQEALVVRRRLPVEEALTLLLPVAGALAWAHDLGVLHRDVKPANIFLAKTTDGKVVPKLLDFGMARLDGQARVTRSGQVVGTVGYMSPEQASGREVGAQADVWSLGAVFFRCLAGVDPFDGPNEANVLLQVALARARPLRSVERSVPEAVARVVERALERDPARRFGHVRAFVHALVTASAEAQVALAPEVDLIGLPDYARWRSDAMRSAASSPPQRDIAATQVSYVRAPDSRDFVGRIEVLEHLSEGVRKAFAGHGGVSLILGEPGMGKTRLMQQLAACARELGASVSLGLCEEGEAAPPYWPWVQMLRALDADPESPSTQQTVDALPPELRAVLEAGSAESGKLPPRHTQQERLRFFDAIASFLERRARTRPLVLLIDDCHWADSASLALLGFLSRRSAQHAIYIVAAYRAEASTDGDALAALGGLSDCEHYRLTALSEHEARELCLRTAGTLLSEARLVGITERSGGNPLFVKELARLYAEHSGVTDAPMPLPAAIKDSIQRRLAQRSPECAAMLECAAVLGASFDLGNLVYVTDRPAGEVLDLLDEARRAHLLRESVGARSRYRFTHALVQEAMLPETESEPRARVLARMAVLLYGGSAPDRVEALAREASRIADAVGDGRTQVAAWIALSLVLGESPSLQDRLALTERMIAVGRASSDSELETHARAHRVCDFLRLGETARCEDEIRQMEATGQRVGNPLFTWSARHARATLHMLRGELAAAEDIAVEARDLARTFMPAAARASFGAQMYPVYRLQGRLDELALIIEHDLVVLPEVVRRGYMAGLALDASDVDAARDHLRWLSADDFARAPRDWSRMPFWARVTELADALEDRKAAAAAYAALAPHHGQLFTIGSTACEGALDHMLGNLSFVLGEREQARTHFARALDINTRLSAMPWVARTQRALARFLRTSDEERDQAQAAELEQLVAATARTRGLHGLTTR